MRKGRQPSNFTLCGLTATLLLVSPGVFAYLDPTTGSMVISAIVGILASIALALKAYWYKIKRFFKRSQEQGGTQQETEIQNSGGPDARKQDSPE